MSSESFSTSPTRQIEAGDTPGFNDDQKSRLMAVQNIAKGTASVQIAGVINIATVANTAAVNPPVSPFVPVESKDNTGDDDLEIRGVGPGQMVALTVASDSSEIFPGEYVQISNTDAGQVEDWAAASNQTKYARYFGKEAGVFSRDGTTPFKEDLSVGVIPDQSIVANEIGWFTLMEAHDA